MDQISPQVKPKPRVNIRKPVDQSMTVKEVIQCGVPGSWSKLFESKRDTLDEISDTLAGAEERDGMWYPRKEYLFNAYYLTPLSIIKICILGQDPYIQIGADGQPRPIGLSFAVRRTDVVPKSLQMIFTELSNDITEFKYPSHGDLTRWCRQGVFLLNASLTVNPAKSGSHGTHLWEDFLISTFDEIGRANPNCIWMLWGGDAKNYAQYIKNKRYILEAAHPVARNGGFLGCKHFSKANEILESLSEKKIDWNLDDPE